MKMNLKPSLRYQLGDLMKSSLAFFCIIIIVVLLIPALRLTLAGEGELSFCCVGVVAAVYLFVVGIVAPRSYIRLDSQLGVSRAGSFTAQLISAVLVSALLAAAIELLSLLAQLFTRSGNEFWMAELYQLMYHDGAALSFSGHLISIAFNMCALILAYISGMFFTLLFWRLNKLWTIAAAIAIFVFFNLILNVSVRVSAGSVLASALYSFSDAAARGPGPLMLLALGLSAVLAAIEWLLLRRAYIRAAA